MTALSHTTSYSSRSLGSGKGQSTVKDRCNTIRRSRWVNQSLKIPVFICGMWGLDMLRMRTVELVSRASMTRNFKYSKCIFMYSGLKQLSLMTIACKMAKLFTCFHWWTQRGCTITIFERWSNKRKISSSESEGNGEEQLRKSARDLWCNTHITVSCP